MSLGIDVIFNSGMCSCGQTISRGSVIFILAVCGSTARRLLCSDCGGQRLEARKVLARVANEQGVSSQAFADAREALRASDQTVFDR